MSILYKGKELKVADAHVHIYPDKIAEKATEAIGHFYDIEMSQYGTDEILKQNEISKNVDKCLVCSVATKAEQTVSITEFIAEKCRENPFMIGLASFHQDYEDVEEIAERAMQLGLKGFKLHPDFQRTNADDERFIRLYKVMAKKGLVLLIHAGDNRYDFSSPFRIANFMDKVPELKCIAAHFGGYRQWDKAIECLPQSNVYIDTSSSLPFISKEQAREAIEKYGTDKVLFGTDFPMWDFEEEFERFKALDLPLEATEKILYTNFEKLFLK